MILRVNASFTELFLLRRSGINNLTIHVFSYYSHTCMWSGGDRAI